MTTVRCKKCDTKIMQNKRGIAGCNCDPDAPTWVYIQPDGRVRGFSQSEWEMVDEEQ